MTRIGLLAAFAAATAAAYAQPQRPDSDLPAPAVETRVEPSSELKDPSPPRLSQAAARGRSDADARHCLELTDNAAVHRCAERYRARASQGKPRL